MREGEVLREKVEKGKVCEREKDRDTMSDKGDVEQKNERNVG